MLFNSLTYLVFFLPAVWVGYFVLNRLRLIVGAKWWLVAASLIFYAGWHPWNLSVLLGSILGNYYIYLRMRKALADGHAWLRGYTILGLGFNLTLLGFFKYLDFATDLVNTFTGAELPVLHLMFPLGISFYTLQQIAFLVDAREGLVRYVGPLDYLLFVTFFPQLVIGPIVHHSQMMPQFKSLRLKFLRTEDLCVGLALLLMGLGKKMILADHLAPYADVVFTPGAALNATTAWIGSVTYTFQIYFDFSGYTDMALGSALLFRIRLPTNFRSPLRSRGVIDFWRRWHITLAEFLQTYVYMPIMLSLPSRTFGWAMLAVFVAFFLSGIWHGPRGTFIAFGALQGLGMVANHFWRRRKWAFPSWSSYFVTYLFIVVSLVLFRSPTLAVSGEVLGAMSGLCAPIEVPMSRLLDVEFIGLIAAAATIAFLLPNSMDLSDRLHRWLRA